MPGHARVRASRLRTHRTHRALIPIRREGVLRRCKKSTCRRMQISTNTHTFVLHAADHGSLHCRGRNRARSRGRARTPAMRLYLGGAASTGRAWRGE
jgi:hypothetical protein